MGQILNTSKYQSFHTIPQTTLQRPTPSADRDWGCNRQLKNPPASRLLQLCFTCVATSASYIHPSGFCTNETTVRRRPSARNLASSFFFSLPSAAFLPRPPNLQRSVASGRLGDTSAFGALIECYKPVALAKATLATSRSTLGCLISMCLCADSRPSLLNSLSGPQHLVASLGCCETATITSNIYPTILPGNPP